KANSTAAETIKGGDEVVFKDGAGVKITQSGKEFTISADTSKLSQSTKLSYTANGVAAKQEVTLADGLNFQDGKFTKASVDTAGKVKYDTVTQGITVTDGKAAVPTTDGLTTAKDIANVVNSLGWKANAGGNVDGGSTSTLVKSGDEVVFKAGDNLTVKQDLSTGKQEYTYKLNKDLTGLDSVTSKKLTVPGTGGKDTVIDSNGINAGGNKITNVAPGVNGTDAVNKSQLDQ
ncbi:hemagglutinin, partial [Fusobacterium periodonticum ATCC 33693]